MESSQGSSTFNRSSSRLSFAGGISGISSVASNTSVMSQAMISQRIVNVEYYMAPPVKEFDNLYSEFRSSGVKKVPVLRIFGSTSAGQKMCANIHGVYPYISILDDESVEGYEYRIATALDNAINETVKTTSYSKGKQPYKNSTQHVFNVSRVVGKSFYGYRSRNEMFLRIFFYNPMMLKRAVDLLHSGNVLGRRFQVFEAHIPYSLQFMIDYSLYGMNYVHYAAAKFRKNHNSSRKNSQDFRSASQGSNSSVPGYVDIDNIDDNMLGPSSITKMTSCELEIDVKACDILMETKTSEKKMSKNPGIDCIWKDEIERRRLHGVDEYSQITIPESQSRSQVELVHPTEEKHLKTLGSKLESYFATNDVSVMEDYADSTLINSQLDDNSDLIPSSQVLDHLSAESQSHSESVENHLSQEEDEFLNLLEKMATSPNSRWKDEDEMVENPFGVGNDDSDQVVACEDEDGEENEWDCSQLDSSILDKINEVEASFQKRNETNGNKSSNSRTILQCDGQAGTSESSSDESSTNLRSRKSSSKIPETKRAPGRPPNSKKKTENNKTPVNKPLESVRKTRNSMASSPATTSRLSLSARRKSRSQDAGKRKPNEDTPVKDSGSNKTVRKSLLRRSRSLSLDEKAPKKKITAESMNRKNDDESKNARKSSSTTSLSKPTSTSSTTTSSKHGKSTNSKSTSSLSTNVDKKSIADVPASTSASTGKLNNLEMEPYILLKRVSLDRKFDPDTLEFISEPGSKRTRRLTRRYVEDSDSSSIVSANSAASRSDVGGPVSTAPSKKLNRMKKDATKEGEKQKSTNESDNQPQVQTKPLEEPVVISKKKKKKIDDESSTCSSANGNTVPDQNDTARITRQKQEVEKAENGVKQAITESNKKSTTLSMSNGPLEEAGNKLKSKLTKKKKKSQISSTATSSTSSTATSSTSSTATSATSSTASISPNLPNGREAVVVLVKLETQDESIDGKTSPLADIQSIPTEMIEEIVAAPADTTAQNVVKPSTKTGLLPSSLPRKKVLGLRRLKMTKIVPDANFHCKGEGIRPKHEIVLSTSPTTTNTVDESERFESIIRRDKSNDTDIQSYATNDLGNPSLIEVEATSKSESISVQTSTVATHDVTVSDQAERDENEGPVKITSIKSKLQTSTRIMVTTASQTDAVVPLCLCQCTCVVKSKSDIGIDAQHDLKPVMESKRIQVENCDTASRARSSRFTTPQSNKIRRSTPSKSPEKRRLLGDSPRVGHSGSRFLSALVLKTPTSHQKSRAVSLVRFATPTQSPARMEAGTPRSRESKEKYLVNSIKAASLSPKKRSLHIKPRNLESESQKSVLDESNNMLQTELTGEENDPTQETALNEDLELKIEDVLDSNGATEAEATSQEDLSINSIYEYEDQSPQVVTSWPDGFESSGTPSAVFPSPFQKKRNLSKHRTKSRLEKKRIANLNANRTIPDAFELEYEPLKQPASYKSTMKWLEAAKHLEVLGNSSPSEKLVNVANDDDSSDEESLPAPIKLFGGGNMSDEDMSDSEGPSSGMATEHVVVKAFTPPFINFSVIDDAFTPANVTKNKDKGTPRSILRQSRGSIARRQSGQVLKRKIRWEDNETDNNSRLKRVKLEGPSPPQNDEQNESVILSNVTLNRTIDTSELDGPGVKNALGLENSMSNFQDVKALHQSQFLTTMCVEVHCASRGGLLPDPMFDSVLVIFVLITTDYPEGFNKPQETLTLLLLDEKRDTVCSNDQNQSTKAYSSEVELLDAFANLVQLWDPDILVGYEIEKASFGYLMQRSLCLGKDLTEALSRVLPLPKNENDKYAAFRGREEWNGTIGGRIVLNIWRLLRHEIAVQSYTFENAAYHILLRRVCKFSQKTLQAYWSHKMHRYKVIQYYTVRVKGVIQIMEKLDLVNRTSELARLFGIQFYEVLSRGSQFRVESMMLRATKPLDFIAPSPNVLQRAKMRAPEYLPLIMEPRSNYYTDPVAVLDFQSLYPSMMIAYNYDYASLLGRVEHLGTTEQFPLGCLDHMVPPSDLLRLKENIHISPAGIAFLDKSVVKGVLPEMLEQILGTRQMVKRAMKRWKNDGASLQKVLDSRQLGLKLIANVTYGYTSANFSGRMPCVEVADSIVSKGRETLQRAINHVQENFDRFGAEVVYGDTDSMFVLFKGKTKDEAFKLAYQIAEEVTQANPKPVKLKFEKIYQPCILQSKKRYVGYAYETPEQTKPIYDAKGIETVRRDGCPAVRKILEKTLHVLFTSNKPEKVEQYLKSQFEKLFKGRVSMQDYIFAKEFRGRAGYKPTASVPSLEIAKRLSETDPRAEPLVSERVPYVVIYGNPSLPLIKLVRTPEEYLANPALRLNAHYYIEKSIIPALNRCLVHAGINVTKWYLQLPRKYLRNVLDQKSKGQGTLDDYVLHQNCLRCDGKAERGLCKKCLSDETSSIIYLQEIVTTAKSKLNACEEICTNCAGETDRCVSVDCPVLHKLTRYQRDQAYMKNVERELANLEW